MARTKETKSIDVFIGNYGTFKIPSMKLGDLSRDKRTREGKLRSRYVNALYELEEIAFSLGLEAPDISPVRMK